MVNNEQINKTIENEPIYFNNMYFQPVATSISWTLFVYSKIGNKLCTYTKKNLINKLTSDSDAFGRIFESFSKPYKVVFILNDCRFSEVKSNKMCIVWFC